MQTKEELERKTAVSRYLSGESPKSICRFTGRPKKWLYKWIGRFKSGDADWFANDSRSPKHSPSKTSPEMGAKIVAARSCLEQTPYACRGVFSIRAQVFQDHCWHKRHLSALKGKTPSQASSGASIDLLPEDFAADLANLGVPPGRISFIRMVRSDHQIDVLGHKFPVGEAYYREYVTACLYTDSALLRIHHQAKQIAEFKFSTVTHVLTQHRYCDESPMC